MQLVKLSLENYKGFEHINIDFDPHLTVIVGMNGAGKSTILEGAAVAISSMFVKMDGLTARGLDKTQAHIRSFSIGGTKYIQPQYPVTITATANINNRTLQWARSLNKPDGKTTIVDAKEITELGTQLQADLRKGKTNLTLPIIAYYGTGRLWDYHREKQNDIFETNNRLNGYIDCVDGTANLKLMMNWFLKMTVQKYQNQELGLGNIPELETVFAAMESCYRRITGCDEVKMQYNLGTRELEVAYREKNGTFMQLPINQLSDGYKSTISLVADIAYRMAVLNPQLSDRICKETDGIILIDEVDLHLHPTWQQRILGDLTEIFPKVQFIVTTHAPAVLSTVKHNNIVLLDQNEVFMPSDEVYGKDINSIVSSVMNTPERPAKIKDMFNSFYDRLDAHDAGGASEVLETLRHLIGDNDPEISSCIIKLKLLNARRVK
ncbi:MAG: AAA family ATPase [Clostridia bacterium]|nr:AAA family ATPase [Clostridia bacterium]